MTGAPHTSRRLDQTRRYTGGVVPTVAAGVTTGIQTAGTPVGQAAVLTAVNMLSRAHPQLMLSVPDAPLLVPTPTGGVTLVDACHRLAAGGNPEIEIILTDGFPSETLSLGIGVDSPTASIYAGGLRWTARTGSTRQPIASAPSSLLGLGLAVGFGCGWIFRSSLGLPAVRERSVSLWTLASNARATGPAGCGPLDVGSVWIVGAGAVGSAVAWWLHQIGVTGEWTIIDGDLADDTNLNRSLGLFAADAGLLGSPAIAKAEAAATLIPGAHPHVGWWDEWVQSDSSAPDVLIPTANDRGVRPAIAAYGHPAVLHATTSRAWTAELHRHVPVNDGCIACRLPGDEPMFGCATGRVDGACGADPGRDAALPFLSGSAGLMLVSGLLQLQHAQWIGHRRNHWRIWFDQASAGLTGSRWICDRGCVSVPSPGVRQALHGHTRWAALSVGLLS